MSWEEMSLSKASCDLGCFNKALLAKLLWRIIKSTHSLSAVILRAKYFLQGDIPTADGFL